MRSSKTLVIILHFGSVLDTLECINSLRTLVAQQFDIFVVNNGPDRTVEATLKARYPDILYRQAGVNTGFAAGNNIGLRFALEHGYHYSLLINNDTVAEQDFLTPLINVLEADPNIAMAGPAIYYYDDKQRLWSCGGRINRWSGRLGGETSLPAPARRCADVDYLPGACILTRNSAVQQIGLLSEQYFLGVEEADWALQARQVGFRIVACSASVLLHKVGVSSQYSPELIYNGVRNRFLFLRRQFKSPVSLFLICCVLLNELRKHSGNRRLCWRAFRDHFKYSTIERGHLDAVQRLAENST